MKDYSSNNLIKLFIVLLIVVEYLSATRPIESYFGGFLGLRPRYGEIENPSPMQYNPAPMMYNPVPTQYTYSPVPIEYNRLPLLYNPVPQQQDSGQYGLSQGLELLFNPLMVLVNTLQQLQGNPGVIAGLLPLIGDPLQNMHVKQNYIPRFDNRRSNNVNGAYGNLPHVAPRKQKPTPSLINKFQNRMIVKPLTESRRSNSDADAVVEHKHVKPTYIMEPRKYSNPFKASVIVSPGKPNTAASVENSDNLDYSDEYAKSPSYLNSQYSPFGYSFPQIPYSPYKGFINLRRKREIKNDEEIDQSSSEVKINKKNAGVDLLQFRRKVSGNANDQKQDVRELIRKLLSF